MRIVSEREFPISTTMTGALLTIKPGSLREVHWHPNAAEWQYYLKGNARMTVFGSHGRARTDDFVAGDVGYVPQGYGHYIENTGATTSDGHRVQQGDLRIDLDRGMDGGQSRSHARNQFRRIGERLREVSQGRGGPARTAKRKPAALREPPRQIGA
jgi:hypothetical protein